MRLLHTSDWHLGRSLHRADLSAAQEQFLDHLVEVVRTEAVDAVLIAGDVYDRAIPPVDSVRLFEESLWRLHDAGTQIVVISGNHDSPQRLGVNSGLLEKTGVHLRTRVADCARPVILPAPGGDEVAVYALPYLEPDAIRQELGADVGRSHADVLGAALARSAADRAGRDPASLVLLAHGWVVGGEASDSERDISVGGVGSVPASLFDGFAYAAFGHLHRPQEVSGTVRYSGSALPYSFSEAGHPKGTWLADLGSNDVQFVPTPVHRRLSSLRGELDFLLASPTLAEYEQDFVAITLIDAARPLGAMDRLRARFPGVLTLSWEPAIGTTDSAGSYSKLVRNRGDLDVAVDFVEYVRNTPATEAERELLADAFTAIRADEDAA